MFFFICVFLLAFEASREASRSAFDITFHFFSSSKRDAICVVSGLFTLHLFIETQSIVGFFSFDFESPLRQQILVYCSQSQSQCSILIFYYSFTTIFLCCCRVCICALFVVWLLSRLVLIQRQQDLSVRLSADAWLSSPIHFFFSFLLRLANLHLYAYCSCFYLCSFIFNHLTILYTATTMPIVLFVLCC